MTWFWKKRPDEIREFDIQETEVLLRFDNDVKFILGFGKSETMFHGFVSPYPDPLSYRTYCHLETAESLVKEYIKRESFHVGSESGNHYIPRHKICAFSVVTRPKIITVNVTQFIKNHDKYSILSEDYPGDVDSI